MHRLREVVNDCGLKPVGFDAGMSSCVDSSRGQETQAARPAGGRGPSRHPSVTEVTEVPRPRIWFLCSGSPFPRPPWPRGQPWAPRPPRSLGCAVPPRLFVSSPLPRETRLAAFWDGAFAECGDGVQTPPGFEPLASVAWSLPSWVLPMCAVVRPAGHTLRFCSGSGNGPLASSLAVRPLCVTDRVDRCLLFLLR